MDRGHFMRGLRSAVPGESHQRVRSPLLVANLLFLLPSAFFAILRQDFFILSFFR
jgi:hypothetical protein